jgi:hypothetical protein
MAKAKAGAKKAKPAAKKSSSPKVGLLKSAATAAARVMKAAAGIRTSPEPRSAGKVEKEADKKGKSAPVKGKAVPPPPPPPKGKVAAPPPAKAELSTSKGKGAKPLPAKPVEAEKPEPTTSKGKGLAAVAKPEVSTSKGKGLKATAPAVIEKPEVSAPKGKGLKATAPAPVAAEKPEVSAPKGKGLKATAAVAGDKPEVSTSKGKGAKAEAEKVVPTEGNALKPLPRATKLPPMATLLTKREMEQLLTAGTGRGVEGEGSLKGRLVVREEFPYLVVIGRDKRELSFLLMGPDQEVLPAYVDHKVSVSGLIKKTTNYGGSVSVRKYSAKKPEAEVPTVEAPPEEKLKYLSPGEVEQVTNAGMGAGMRGFASMRGVLEMTGEEFFLVVSNGGTRQQVSFALQGKHAKGLRKLVGQTLHIQGVVEKTSGWGGNVQLETFDPRPSESRSFSRANLETVHVDLAEVPKSAELKTHQALTVRLEEKAGFTWAVEPTIAKRVGLREANFEPGTPATREFLFTPRTPGAFEVDFFLAKALSPLQVDKTYRLSVMVRP